MKIDIFDRNSQIFGYTWVRADPTKSAAQRPCTRIPGNATEATGARQADSRRVDAVPCVLFSDRTTPHAVCFDRVYCNSRGRPKLHNLTVKGRE